MTEDDHTVHNIFLSCCHTRCHTTTFTHMHCVYALSEALTHTDTHYTTSATSAR